AAIVLAGTLAVSLVGCGPAGPTPTATVASSTSPPTATASTPTPTATAAPFVVDCLSIIPQSRRDWVASSGWPLFAPADFFAKNRSEVASSPYILMQDNGGIVCPYATSLEIVLAYGYAPLADSQVTEANSLILGAGDSYATSSYAGGTLYDSATEGNAFEFFLIVPGAIYVASTVEILDEMMATIP
ncbi:MAG: hypothetical protein Q8M65_02825, partial [Rhodoglobus sp.]|nr:hypothetical protein [Rhodoglobus sp.]